MSYASENRKWLAPLVRTIADQMGLRDWDVRLGDEPPEEQFKGTAEVAYGRRSIRICLAEPDDRDDLTQTIIHELLHAYTAPLDWHKNSLMPVLGNSAFAIYEGAFEDVIEVMVDAIAVAWAETLPLPETSEVPS